MAKSRSSVFALFGLGVIIALAVWARASLLPGNDHGASVGGPYSLVNQDGQAVTDKDFRGRWQIIYFGYTFCPDVCPTALGTMATALDRLSPAERAKVAPIFITIDPARDTPAVLKDYVAAFAPDMAGLTGSDEQVKAAAKAFKVYAAKGQGGDNGAYAMDHSSILYLMGPDGAYVRHFPHGSTAEDVAAELQKRLK